MVNIDLYQKEQDTKTPVAFYKGSMDYIKIMDISSYDQKKGFALAFTIIAERAGVTNPINNYDKTEIQELILRRYKRFSFQELLFAFKMERQLEMGEITPHYNRFTVTYVAKVLKKYTEWRSNFKFQNNIPISNALPESTSITESEKKEIITKGVLACYDYFKEKGEIENGRMYVYDVLYDLGLLPVDVEIKKKYIEEAKELLKHKADSMKPKNRYELKNQKDIYKKILDPKDPIVVITAKKISIKKYFRTIDKTNLKKELNRL